MTIEVLRACGEFVRFARLSGVRDYLLAGTIEEARGRCGRLRLIVSGSLAVMRYGWSRAPRGGWRAEWYAYIDGEFVASGRVPCDGSRQDAERATIEAATQAVAKGDELLMDTRGGGGRQ